MNYNQENKYKFIDIIYVVYILIELYISKIKQSKTKEINKKEIIDYSYSFSFDLI